MATKQQITGMCGVYLVAYELTARGLGTAITSRNAEGADILVSSTNRAKGFSVSVKTNGKNSPFWLLNKKAQDNSSPSYIYVLVNLRDTGNEFYVVSSEVVKEKMVYEKSKTGSEFYSIRRSGVLPFKDKWELFKE